MSGPVAGKQPRSFAATTREDESMFISSTSSLESPGSRREARVQLYDLAAGPASRSFTVSCAQFLAHLGPERRTLPDELDSGPFGQGAWCCRGPDVGGDAGVEETCLSACGRSVPRPSLSHHQFGC